MKKLWIIFGASFLGFGLYNIIFHSKDTYLNDFLIPIINLRYSQLVTPLASKLIIGIGFVLIIIGAIRMRNDKYN